ncbi:MAG: hypothetical protein A3K04_01475 [Gallionellales bacterium RBG_16_56_9]|nr:MAG: hypothetical protein A3K04_01475 [Gallionellales bacterium RBG_16_56_9]
MGIILIFLVSATKVDPAYQKLIMGASLGIALPGEHPDTVSMAGMWHNLLWVILGNTISGALFMAAAYWFASRPAMPTKAASGIEEVPRLL